MIYIDDTDCHILVYLFMNVCTLLFKNILISIIGKRGRPQLMLPREHLEMFQKLGFSVPKMAQHFHCSIHQVYKRLYEGGLHQRKKYTTISDHELYTTIADLHQMYPNTGSVVRHLFNELYSECHQEQANRNGHFCLK